MHVCADIICDGWFGRDPLLPAWLSVCTLRIGELVFSVLSFWAIITFDIKSDTVEYINPNTFY